VKRLIAPVVCLVLVLSACSSKTSPGSSGSTGSTALTVFAASSLKGAFTQIGSDFTVANPGDTVTFNFGPSDGLAGQIESEGTADVFASASAKWMDEVQQKVGVEGRIDFAQNRLVIIAPPDNPASVASIADLANPGVQLVLAATGVPVGDYAREALTNAGIADAASANVVSNEEDDASAVAKITSGEADAAIVYASDVTDQVAPQVTTIQIPDDLNVLATYPMAVVTGSENADVAQAFVAYVSGSAGQATLKTFGFLPPPAS
jgi:molybdate transport system substrate-binding protein